MGFILLYRFYIVDDALMVVWLGRHHLTHIHSKRWLLCSSTFFLFIFLGKYPYTVLFCFLDQLHLFSYVDQVVHDQYDKSPNFGLVAVCS